MKPLLRLAICSSFLMVPALLRGQSQPQPSAHWVTTWAVAQELAPTTQEKPALPPGLQIPDFNTMPGPRPSHAVPEIADQQTIRMIAHTSIGGKRLRIELSNAFGKDPVMIGEAHIALRESGATIDKRTDRQLTFSGKSSFQIAPGVIVVSDPIEFAFRPMSDLAISLYVTKNGGAPTNHMIGLHTAYISDGNQTPSETLKPSETTTSYLWLRSVDVAASADDFAIACLGDSITDGYGTTKDADQSWPALLAKRLLSTGKGRHVAVVNEGISGNEVLHNGAGVSALARLDRDILSEPGVRWVILLEGINDINLHGQVQGPDALTAEDLIRGYVQIISRLHMNGIKVAGATLTPEKGVWLTTEIGENTRLKVNQWIRTSGAFDRVFDFDLVLRDKVNPSKIKDDYDPGDHIHPNDRGNAAMTAALDLRDFQD